MKKGLWFCLFAGIIAGCAAIDGGEESATVTVADGEFLAPLAACTATAGCCNGSTVTCSGNTTCVAMDFDDDPKFRGWVSCDGVKTPCPSTTCGGDGGSTTSSSGGIGCPGAPQIYEYLHPCYPSVHPYGRYEVLNASSALTYTWSGTNVTFLSGTSGTDTILKPTSVGGYTVKVTAKKTGCTPVTGSANYYAESCSGSGNL